MKNSKEETNSTSLCFWSSSSSDSIGSNDGIELDDQIQADSSSLKVSNNAFCGHGIAADADSANADSTNLDSSDAVSVSTSSAILPSIPSIPSFLDLEGTKSSSLDILKTFNLHLHILEYMEAYAVESGFLLAHCAKANFTPNQFCIAFGNDRSFEKKTYRGYFSCSPKSKGRKKGESNNTLWMVINFWNNSFTTSL